MAKGKQGGDEARSQKISAEGRESVLFPKKVENNQRRLVALKLLFSGFILLFFALYKRALPKHAIRRQRDNELPKFATPLLNGRT